MHRAVWRVGRTGVAGAGRTGAWCVADLVAPAQSAEVLQLPLTHAPPAQTWFAPYAAVHWVSCARAAGEVGADLRAVVAVGGDVAVARDAGVVLADVVGAVVGRVGALRVAGGAGAARLARVAGEIADLADVLQPRRVGGSCRGCRRRRCRCGRAYSRRTAASAGAARAEQRRVLQTMPLATPHSPAAGSCRRRTRRRRCTGGSRRNRGETHCPSVAQVVQLLFRQTWLALQSVPARQLPAVHVPPDRQTWPVAHWPVCPCRRCRRC